MNENELEKITESMLQTLEAENKKLRKALKEIKRATEYTRHVSAHDTEIFRIAKKALQRNKKS